MKPLATEAPAKLNLALEVVGRRGDGFHDLWTLFDALELGDRLLHEPGPGTDPYLELDGAAGIGAALPVGADNLVLRAARAFADATGLATGGRFVLTKRVPAGAGLGGGSSDAAAALRLLCRRHDRDATGPDIEALARGLGADVPFFLHGGRAWADGRGDRIHPLTGTRALHYLLLFPGRPCATAEVFARCSTGTRGGLYRPRDGPKLPDGPVGRPRR